ncbi:MULTISPECIES: hypothetical protein [Cellvibrio]|jgi:hypothetical protein|uniref:Uncharacterized protein n=1 Tax=Cellvibrio fibrivorans TaxID=126350 RepID=A0ABU1UUR5_9GAMM|nr:hypothetical protein [Cellvibrio fibrivorans]MDR7088931.1 hypothetical protein [Cellvibrio fibrivorans]
MKRAKLYVDFNEMLDDNLCLLSKEDKKLDSEGNIVQLFEGLEIDVYMDDCDESGMPDPLIASGKVEMNTSTDWSSHVKWCVRIDEKGIQRSSQQ